MTILRPEFSRRIKLSRIGAAGIEHVIVADPGECRALAGRMGVPAVASLTCRFRLTPLRQGRISAEAELRSELTRICVVSLEPFETSVLERFTLCFVPETSAEMTEVDQLDLEAADELTYEGEQIDLGEAASEQLALALDPYPRMPGVAPPAEGVSKPSDHAVGPFAVLARRRGTGSPD